MTFDGNGNWTSTFFPVQDASNDIPILASKFDALIQSNLPQSFENCMTIDQQTLLQTDLKINNFKILNVASGTISSDGVNLGQVVEKNLSNNTTYPLKTSLDGSEWFYGDDNGTPFKVLSDNVRIYADGYIKGGVLTYNTTSIIDISNVKARSSDNTTDLTITGVSLDITQNSSWASGTAPSLVDASIFVWADDNSGTQILILDDATGSNIVNPKRLVGAFIADNSGDIISFKSDELSGGGIELLYDTKILLLNQTGVFDVSVDKASPTIGVYDILEFRAGGGGNTGNDGVAKLYSKTSVYDAYYGDSSYGDFVLNTQSRADNTYRVTNAIIEVDTRPVTFNQIGFRLERI